MGEIGGGREGEIFGPATYLTQRTLRAERNSEFRRSANVRKCECGGRADGLHRPIKRFRLEWLSDPIG